MPLCRGLLLVLWHTKWYNCILIRPDRLLFIWMVCLGTGFVHAQGIRFSPLAEAPDYGQLGAWAAHPDVEDASDFSSTDIEAFDARFDRAQAEVPTFFIYPTIYQKGDLWNANPMDSAHRDDVSQSTIKLQSSVFNGLGPVWSPYYRQMHYRGYVPRRKDNLDEIDAAFDTAYADVLRAFHHFLDANPSGPFILAGHSQGTHHGVRLLREVVAADTNVSQRLMVAFLVGGLVNADNTDGFPICEHPDDLNCWVGWRTVSKRHHPRKASDDDLLVNPMTWSVQRPVASISPSALNAKAAHTSSTRSSSPRFIAVPPAPGPWNGAGPPPAAVRVAGPGRSSRWR